MLGTNDGSRHKARRGLAIFFAIVVPLSAIFEVLIIATGNFSWLIPLVWVPALASVAARLELHEGFSDMSFPLGGRRGWSTILLALIFPIVVGLIAYGIAWMSALARFAPRSDLAGDAASPFTTFVAILVASTTIGTVALVLTAAGEEIGWRGYMLTRLIDSGVPQPVLVSGLLWGLWHVAGTLTGVYATGPSPVLSAMLLMVTIARAPGRDAGACPQPRLVCISSRIVRTSSASVLPSSRSASIFASNRSTATEASWLICRIASRMLLMSSKRWGSWYTALLTISMHGRNVYPIDART